MIGIADGHHIYIIFLCSFKSCLICKRHTQARRFWDAGRVKKGEKQPLSRQAKEKTTREVVVFLFLYLNDLYSYFSTAFSNTKSNFFPGKVPVNCKSRLSLGAIADLLRTFQVEKQPLSRSDEKTTKVTFIQV